MKDKYELSKDASHLRKQLSEDERSSVDIFRLAQSIDNLTLVFYPMGDNISGMCVKGPKDAVIAVNSSMTLGRQRFSMAHEFYHYYFDNEMSATVCTKDINSGNSTEREANIFASFFLAPPAALSEAINEMKHGGRLSIGDVIKLEQRFGISRQAILIRLIEEKELTSQEADSMKVNIISSAVSLGFSDELYRPLPVEKQYMTYGRYIQQAEELAKQGLISNGKYEELLLEAFRTDIVYGVDIEGGELVD